MLCCGLGSSLIQMFKSLLQHVARAFGYEIRKIQPLASGRDWIVDLQQLLRAERAPVIFDVGANVGQTSLRLATAFPAPAGIFTFEPASATFAQLATALAPHPHVHPCQMALGDKPGRLRLHHGLNSQLSRLVPIDTIATGTYEEVEVSTLDQVVARFALDRIDVLKTDTEGHDGAVLRGASGLLQRGAIRAVVSEATFDTANELHTRFDEIRAQLEPHGFCLHNIYDCVHWDHHMKYCNVLYLHEADFRSHT